MFIFSGARGCESRVEGREGVEGDTLTREWPILRARFTPREKFTRARGVRVERERELWG